MNPAEKTCFTVVTGFGLLGGVGLFAKKHAAVVLRSSKDNQIIVKSYAWTGFLSRFSVMNLPVLRGIARFLESVAAAIDALSVSAEREVIKSSTKDKPRADVSFIATIVAAFFFAAGLFVWVPRLLSQWIASDSETSGVGSLAQVLDGVLKVGTLFGYFFIISKVNEVKRVFRFQAAIHKALWTFERGEEIGVNQAKLQPILHPFFALGLGFTMISGSILFFSIAFPFFRALLDLGHGSGTDFSEIGLKVFLMLPMTGLVYEGIVFAANHPSSTLARVLLYPSYMLQKWLLSEPSEQELELAVVGVRQILRRERGIPSPMAQKTRDGSSLSEDDEFVIPSVASLSAVKVPAQEFRI